MLLFVLFAALQAPSDWQPLAAAGKAAYTARDYPEAAAKFAAAADAALASPGDEAGARDALRFLSAVRREMGELEGAEAALQRAVDISKPTDPALLEDLSQIQRAQGKSAAGLVNLERAIFIRRADAASPRVSLARDMTVAASMYMSLGQADAALQGFRLAIREWDAASPGDYQALPALDALAAMYRDQSKYDEAEPLLNRSLRIRESTSGPESADVIQSVDSLAFIEFGLRKMPEAEALYKRLLWLWINNAGPEHPMVALAHDKIAELYSFQKRYDEAEEHSRAALGLRTRVHVTSLNQTARILVLEGKLEEAADLFHRTLEVGELAQATDETLDPVLRSYALVLRRLKHDTDADPIEKRIDKTSEKLALRPAPKPKP